jgi:spermidine synthase
MVHGLLSCLSKPKSVLIIGGLDGGALREVLKWSSVDLVVQANHHKIFNDDYLKIGPEWVRKIYNDPRVKYVNKYGLYFLEELDEAKNTVKFDAIIIGANEAEDIMGLRLFYSALNRLAEGGGIALYAQKISDKYGMVDNTYFLQKRMMDDMCKTYQNYTYFKTNRILPSCDLNVNTLYFVPKPWDEALYAAPRISSCRHFTKDQFKDSLIKSEELKNEPEFK